MIKVSDSTIMSSRTVKLEVSNLSDEIDEWTPMQIQIKQRQLHLHSSLLAGFRLSQFLNQWFNQLIALNAGDILREVERKFQTRVDSQTRRLSSSLKLH